MTEILLTLATILGHLVFLLAVLVCLVLVPIGLPGSWGIVVLAGVYGVVTSFDGVTIWDVVGLALAAGVGELIEFLGSLAGAKKYGASKWGMAAGTVGGIAGAILGVAIPPPIVGSVIGAFAGCFAATVAAEYLQAKQTKDALKAGVGAFLGRLVSTFAKTAIAMAMAVWLVCRIYW